MYTDADIEMAEATEISNQIDQLCSDEGITEKQMEHLTDIMVADINRGGDAAGSPVKGLANILSDSVGMAPTNEQFHQIAWNAWAKSDLGHGQ